MSERLDVRLQVNGEEQVVNVEPRMSLADALRDKCGLTGTHLGCEHGVCGACTVLCDGEPVRSCLMLAVQAEGTHLRTVEGLADADGTLHPVQEAFWQHHGLQCGFCTPGFLMLAASLVEREEVPSDDELDDLIASNLCRCTGYQNIRTAIRAALAATHP
jgi:carbon-monoxide dehydrogenase small subunit